MVDLVAAAARAAGRIAALAFDEGHEFDIELLREGKYLARDIFGFVGKGNPTVPALAGEIDAAASGDGAAAPPVGDLINAESTPQAAAAPAPIADAAPAGTREPVTIRENTGASDRPRADDLLPPFAGNPVSMTISPDVLALMHELDVARASGIANAATVAAEPGGPADGAAAAQGESHAGRQYGRP